MQSVTKIIFIDLNGAFVDEVKKNFGTSIFLTRKHTVTVQYVWDDIRRIGEDNAAYVSPANSKLFFDGGIDLIYGRMFPELQGTAQEYIKKFKYTHNGIHFLPIGSAMVVPVKSKYGMPANQHIVAAPTMFNPEVIKGTDNVYWATLAALFAVEKYNCNIADESKHIKTLIIPGMGTGCGRVHPHEAARQISVAFDHFQKEENFGDETPNDPKVYTSVRGKVTPQ